MFSVRDNGGLKMIDISSFAKSLRTKWVKLFTDDRHRPSKLLFDVALKEHGGAFLFKCNFTKGDFHTTNNFIDQICDAWAEYNYSVPEREFSNQIVLNNSQIRVDNRILYNDTLKMHNAYLVSDFFAEDGAILSNREFVSRFNIEALPFTLCFGLISALPVSWKRNVTSCELPNENTLKYLKFISVPKSTNYLYKLLLKKRVATPSAISKWQSLSGENVHFNWGKIFSLPYRAVRNRKIQYFQFRFIHRILGVNEYLYKMKMVNSPLCQFCLNENESIDHLFWHCPIVAKFFFFILFEEIFLHEFESLSIWFSGRPPTPYHFFHFASEISYFHL